MENNPENIPQVPADAQLERIKFLAGLDEITDDDIANLRSNVLPEWVDSFDNREPEDDKRVMALLFKMSGDEIKDLVRLQREAKYIVGIHTVGSRLLHLSMLTGDKRWYDDYYLTKKPE